MKNQNIGLQSASRWLTICTTKRLIPKQFDWKLNPSWTIMCIVWLV